VSVDPERRRAVPSAADFTAWWNEAGGAGADPALEAHVREAHDVLVAPRPDLARLQRALADLLGYLAGPGRSPENCRATDAFFCLLTAEHVDLVERLPRAWQDVVDDLGIDLGASLDDPEVADRDGTSPERLLERVHALVVPGAPAGG